MDVERQGSGDGERDASMARGMPYEPLPASVLSALVGRGLSCAGHVVSLTMLIGYQNRHHGPRKSAFVGSGSGSGSASQMCAPSLPRV